MHNILSTILMILSSGLGYYYYNLIKFAFGCVYICAEKSVIYKLLWINKEAKTLNYDINSLVVLWWLISFTGIIYIYEEELLQPKYK